MSRVTRTHCVNGHEYTPENTYYRKDGKGRCCRVCRKLEHERSDRSRGAHVKADRVRRPRFEAVKRYLRIPAPLGVPQARFADQMILEHEIPAWARMRWHDNAVTFDWYETRKVEAA